MNHNDLIIKFLRNELSEEELVTFNYLTNTDPVFAKKVESAQLGLERLEKEKKTKELKEEISNIYSEMHQEEQRKKEQLQKHKKIWGWAAGIAAILAFLICLPIWLYEPTEVLYAQAIEKFPQGELKPYPCAYFKAQAPGDSAVSAYADCNLGFCIEKYNMDKHSPLGTFCVANAYLAFGRFYEARKHFEMTQQDKNARIQESSLYYIAMIAVQQGSTLEAEKALSSIKWDEQRERDLKNALLKEYIKQDRMDKAARLLNNMPEADSKFKIQIKFRELF